MIRLHHVQVACPPGGEAAARRFYGDALGLREVEKPAELAARGGVWFRAYDGEQVTTELHVGVDADFTPARKAHPALLLRSVADLDETGDRLLELGFHVSADDRHTMPGYLRLHAVDAVGNRVELLASADATD